MVESCMVKTLLNQSAANLTAALRHRSLQIAVVYSPMARRAFSARRSHRRCKRGTRYQRNDAGVTAVGRGEHGSSRSIIPERFAISEDRFRRRFTAP
jgi:hypothetical protein